LGIHVLQTSNSGRKTAVVSVVLLTRW
jgi:hypothetical protein